MLDNWTITDADETWDFRITVVRDDDEGTPDKRADVYDPEMMGKECGPEAAQWARDALKAWKEDLWQWAVLNVTPVLKDTGVVFEEAHDCMAGVDYGWLPGDKDDPKGTDTSNREYLRTSHLNDMIETAREQANEQLNKIRKGGE
jgi:hypothetical protein